jgi:hypothetical protein
MGSFPGTKQPVLEADHSSPSTVPYFCLAWCLVKDRHSCGFTFTSDKYSLELKLKDTPFRAFVLSDIMTGLVEIQQERSDM